MTRTVIQSSSACLIIHVFLTGYTEEHRTPTPPSASSTHKPRQGHSRPADPNPHFLTLSQHLRPLKLSSPSSFHSWNPTNPSTNHHRRVHNPYHTLHLEILTLPLPNSPTSSHTYLPLPSPPSVRNPLSKHHSTVRPQHTHTASIPPRYLPTIPYKHAHNTTTQHSPHHIAQRNIHTTSHSHNTTSQHNIQTSTQHPNKPTTPHHTIKQQNNNPPTLSTQQNNKTTNLPPSAQTNFHFHFHFNHQWLCFQVRCWTHTMTYIHSYICMYICM